MHRVSRTLLLIPLVVGATLPAQSADPVRALPYTRVVLPNGLTVILNEDHALPIVALDIFYKIGYRDDQPSLAGVSHFCEHIFTNGTSTLPQTMNAFYRGIGASSPHYALTNEDITNLYVVIPSNQLETALWAEADRMAHPLSLADSQHVAAERSVLARERASQHENLPGGLARDVVLRTMYPEGHPYYMPGVSPMPDLQRITADDLKRQCVPAYAPNNAVLVLSGDINSRAAKKLVEKYFGGIPRTSTFARRAVPRASISTERRVVLEDSRITAPQLRIVWPGASYSDPDRLALMATASILSFTRFAFNGSFANVGVEPPTTLGRLSRVLVNERQLATRVIVEHYDEQLDGQFEIAVFPRPNVSLTTIENVVDSVVAGLRSTPVTHDEITLFNNFNDVFLQASLQPHFMRADTLAHDEVYAGDPTAYAKQALAAHALTPADIDRAVKRYLGRGRVVLSLIPTGKFDLIAKPELPYINASEHPTVSNR